MAFDPISVGLGIGGSIIGSIGQNSANAKAKADAKKAAKAAAKYQNKVNEKNWKYALKIRQYEWNQTLKIWDKAKDTYSNQLQFNNAAAQRSYDAENQKLNEYLQGLAFEKQGLFVDMMKAQGQAGVTGLSGNSSQRLMNDNLADFGRNNAILAENLVSAGTQHRQDLATIALQHTGADFDAFARLGVRPEPPPIPPKPVKVKAKAAAGGGGANVGLQIANAVVGGLAAGYTGGGFNLFGGGGSSSGGGGGMFNTGSLGFNYNVGAPKFF